MAKLSARGRTEVYRLARGGDSPKAGAKQPWKQNQYEFRATLSEGQKAASNRMHREAVELAVAEGKEVPEFNLKEYGLTAKTGAAPQAARPTAPAARVSRLQHELDIRVKAMEDSIARGLDDPAPRAELELQALNDIKEMGNDFAGAYARNVPGKTTLPEYKAEYEKTMRERQEWVSIRHAAIRAAARKAEAGVKSGISKATYNRGDVNSAVEAAKRLKADHSLFISPTTEGFGIWKSRPAPWEMLQA